MTIKLKGTFYSTEFGPALLLGSAWQGERKTTMPSSNGMKVIIEFILGSLVIVFEREQKYPTLIPVFLWKKTTLKMMVFTFKII